MKQNEKFLKESVDLLSREFGEPLPTLKTVMKKHQTEKSINESTQKQEIQTEFGRFKIVHGENPTAPGYAPEYFLEVNLNNKYLGHFMIEGDPQKKGGKFKVTIHKGFKQVGIK